MRMGRVLQEESIRWSSRHRQVTWSGVWWQRRSHSRNAQRIGQHALPQAALLMQTPRATILSVDGISVCDSISRVAMLRGLQRMEGGDALLPFGSLFYGSLSTYLWLCMRSHKAKEGDVLMLVLSSLGQHSALEGIQTLRAIHGVFWRSVCTMARLSCGTDGPKALTEAAQRLDFNAIVWRGDVSLPTQDQGVMVLGIPMGHLEFVRSRQQVWRNTTVWCHNLWGMLHCALARPNYMLRVVHVVLSAKFPVHHDATMRQVLSQFVAAPRQPPIFTRWIGRSLQF